MNNLVKSVDFKLETKQINEEDGVFTFEGFASTFGNIDRDGDIIMPGAFTETIKEMVPAMLWQHNSNEPVGTFEQVEERPDGLFVRGTMPLDDTFVKGRVVPQMNHGSVTQMSIGFSILDSENKSNGIREISRVKLWEISLVTIPANPMANITGMKAAQLFKYFDIDMDRSFDAEQASERCAEFYGGVDSDGYKKCFLGHDIKAPCFVDIINGAPTAMWGPIVKSAVKVLLGDINDDVIKAHIQEYYDRADRPSPFRKGAGVCDVDMVKVLDKSDFEKFLRKGVCFSRDASKVALSQREAGIKENKHGREADVILSEIVKNLKETTASLKG